MGTPVHDPVALLEHSEWVRALARTLVRDPVVAEDVVQETWLAALRQPPPGDRPARAWLAAVARNVARQFGRAQSRRDRREAASARSEALPSDQELGERVALQQWVVDEVMGLDEPYRHTILLRFFEGLPPRDIALRMGIPLETVKSRLRRGLERLRGRMDSARGPGGVRGVLALLPLTTPTPTSAVGAGALLMGKKSLALVAVALVLFVGGWWVVGLLGPAGSVEADGVSELPGRVGELAARDEALIPDAVESGVTREAVVAGEAVFTIRVVEQGSGAPLPGAELWFMPWADVVDREIQNGRGASFDIEAAARSEGRAFPTDSLGEVHVPASDVLSIAVGRRGDLFGRVNLRPRAGGEAELPMRLDRTLILQTVDETGEPVGRVPVAIAKLGTSALPQVRWRAATDTANGRVTLHHFDHTLERELGEGAMFLATLASPWPDPPSVQLDPRSLPEAPVRLVVERGGRVVVRCLDERGEPLPVTGVHLTEVRPWRDSIGRGTRPMRHGRLSVDGSATFDHVAPGLELMADANPGSHRRVEQVFLGPTLPGQEVAVTLRFLERNPEVRATLVDGDGAAIVQRPIDVRAFVQEDEQDDRSITGGDRTDLAGGFRDVLPTREASDRLREIVFTTDEAYEGGALAATVSVTEAPVDGVYDLGRVVLEPPPVILSGRVVDARGEPIYWAGVWVMRVPETVEPGEVPYTWVHPWQTQTHEDGTFQLTGDQGPGDYRLLVKKVGYLAADEIPFQPGTYNVEVVLLEEGGLEGSLKLPEAVPPTWLRVAVYGADIDYRDPMRPHADGTFFLEQLAPGEVDVEVTIPSWPEPLVRIRGVAVEGGVLRADPRLAHLDLTTAIHRLDLELRAADGAAIPVGSLGFESPGGTSGKVAFNEGSAAFLAPTPIVDLELVAPGFRPQRFEGVQTGQRLVLERGIPVRVRLPDDFELPGPRTTLSLQLLPARMNNPDPAQVVYADDGSRSDSWGRRQYATSVEFVAVREVTLAVGSPGEWQVSWTLASERSRGGIRGREGDPQAIEVGETGLLEPLELAPDAEEIVSWQARWK